MLRFDDETDVHPNLASLLDRLDPWVLGMLKNPDTRAMIDDFEELISDTELPGKPFMTAYSYDGHLVHVRADETRTLCHGFVVDTTKRSGEHYPASVIRSSTYSTFSGTPEVAHTTDIILRTDPETPLLTDVAQPLHDQAIDYAFQTLSRWLEQATVRLEPAGWSYSPSGSAARVPLHDWYNLQRQRELIAARGFVFDEAPPTESSIYGVQFDQNMIL